MKAWHGYGRALGALIVGLQIQTAGAQTTQTVRAGQTAGPKFLVPVLHSTDKALGVQAADEIRSRLMSDYMGNQLWIVEKRDIESTLTASGYPTTDALTPNDLKVLAPSVHADEYLDGTISREGSGSLTLHATLNLVRPNGMTQPLPDITDPKLGGISKQLSGELDKARKQIPQTRLCLTALQARKYEEALDAARKAIAAYPKAVFARSCMLESAYSSKAPPDSIIKISEEILSIYPQSARALKLVTDAYGTKGMTDKYIESMLNMLKADPTNSDLQDQVVNELGKAKKWDMAAGIIKEAVKQNPGDVNLLKSQDAIYRGMQNWKGAAEIEEELIKVDTASADTTAYKKLIGVYVQDSQPQKAAETVARATAKFPRNAGLWLSYASLSRAAGQLPQALAAVNKVLEIDPKYPQAAITKVTILREMNQTDSVIPAVRVAVASGEDKATMGQLVVGIGNALYGAWSKDSSHTMEQGTRLIAVLAYADSLNPSDAAKFLQGATKLSMGQTLLNGAVATARSIRTASAADKEKACSDSKRAQDLLVEAGPQLQAGGKAFPTQASQLLQAQMQLTPYADQVGKVVCAKK